MARKRNLDPAFFRHRGLWEAEQASRLPLRLAFAGLWCVADREGRFRWRPWEIRLDVMPYDEGLDFDAVMEALRAAGFVRRYVVDGEPFGEIPSFRKYQHIHPKEARSRIPPCNSTELPGTTRNSSELQPEYQAFQAFQAFGDDVHETGTSSAAAPAVPDLGLSPEGQGALEGFVRAAQNPTALLAEVRAILAGMRPGTPSDPGLVSRALMDLRLAGVARPTGKQLRAFVLGADREAAPRPTPARRDRRPAPDDPPPNPLRKYRPPDPGPGGPPRPLAEILAEMKIGRLDSPPPPVEAAP